LKKDAHRFIEIVTGPVSTDTKWDIFRNEFVVDLNEIGKTLETKRRSLLAETNVQMRTILEQQITTLAQVQE
jgi:hypothetical protein